MIHTDVLVIGQGLAGSLLAYELEKAGVNVTIIDNGSRQTSSRVAGGLYNPITGRNMVKTWLADEVFPSLDGYYATLQEILGRTFHHPLPIYRPFFNMEEQNDWIGKAASDTYKAFVNQVHVRSIGIDGLLDPFGGVEVKCSGYIDLPEMLDGFESYFRDKGNYLRQEVAYPAQGRIADFQVAGIRAGKIVFCEGAGVANNPFWNYLKFKPVKGEVIDLNLVMAPNQILNRGVFLIPKNGYSTVGSTYDHSDLTLEPTEKGINSIKEKLNKIISTEYQLVSSRAGIRPSTYDRKPFMGFHPDWPDVGIFNGLGPKGVSLAPFFARHMTEHMVSGNAIMNEVRVDR